MSNLSFILSKKFDGTYTGLFTGGPQEVTGNGAKFTTTTMSGITNILTFSDQTENETSEIYFQKFFKYINNSEWSSMLPIDQLTATTFTPCEPLTLEFYYYRTIDGDGVSNTSLYVNNIMFTGEYQMSVYDSEAQLDGLLTDASGNTIEGDGVILASSDIYKIFRIDDFQVISNHNNYNIWFRFTQDDNRTYTQWERLTKENISTVVSKLKISPLRFTKVEYLIKNTSTQGLMVYDIILEGDFQNVSADYLKTNRYGLKEDCLTYMASTPGTPGSDNVNMDFYTSCLGSYRSSDETINSINSENASNTSQMWNPYQTNAIALLNDMLSNQVAQIFGWTVEYHRADPDKNGMDTYLHEYTLKNIVQMKKIKIVVPDNKFPHQSIIMNQFNMDLFDSFEVHVTKDIFKNAFGIEKRPAKDDIIYFCETNMLYIVKHAQAYKDVMNAATYYKLFLEKYEYRTDIRNLHEESKANIKAVTDNTTLDGLFGNEMKSEEQKIANKDQTLPTTSDKVRARISTHVVIIDERIQLITKKQPEYFNVVTKYYDLSSEKIKQKPAINYTKIDQNLKKSDNRSIFCWFNLKNSYDENSVPNRQTYIDYDVKAGTPYNFIKNYNDDTKLGYKFFYQGDILTFVINNKRYMIQQKLLTNIWYCALVNLEQRQETLKMYLYSRNGAMQVRMFNPVSYERVDLSIDDTTGITYYQNSGFKKVTNIEEVGDDVKVVATSEVFTIDPFEFSHEEEMKLLGSNIYYSNLRVLNEVIPEESIDNIIIENILRDEQHIILSDNANIKLITLNYWNKNIAT